MLLTRYSLLITLLSALGVYSTVLEEDRIDRIESTYSSMAQWADSTRAALRDYKGGISPRLLHAASQSRKIMDPATEVYKGVPSFNDEESRAIANGTSMMRGHAVDLANMVGGKAHALKAYGGGPIAKNMLQSHYNKDMSVLDSMADKVVPSCRDSVRSDTQDITDAYLAALRHF